MDIVYIHSPITYSIARQLAGQGRFDNPLLVCGRGLVWDGHHVTVIDDGIWNPERTVEFLVKLSDALPPSPSPLHVYLPHTGYLLGKILKLSTAVAGISYLEEGNTSCNALLASPSQDQPVDTHLLLQLLQRHPAVMAKLQLTAQNIHDINRVRPIWFDDACPKYRGAYRVSPDAFPTLGKVTTLTLPPQNCLAETERNWLCFLPNIINLVARYGTGTMETQKLLHGLVIALRTMKALVTDRGGKLVIKFHPVDDANLSNEFKGELFRFGESYAGFSARHAIDAQLEPTLFNFDRFIVVNESAASRYARLFHGQDCLIPLQLD